METRSIDDILQEFLPKNELKEVNRILYGDQTNLSYLGSEEQFSYDIEKYRFTAITKNEQVPRITKIAAIQHSVVLPTDRPIQDQKLQIFKKIEHMIEKSSELGANIVCLPECWNMPFGFVTREKMPWCEYAEDCNNGPSTMFIKRLAQKHAIVIISPIIERDNADLLWNTSVVVSECGIVLGTQRKNHIPTNNGESDYYTHGTSGQRVFDTKFGKIGVIICFDRHQPQNWLMYALNGAEIVFNPAATSATDSWWPIEARSAAFDHSYYVVAVNRVGIEKFHLESGAEKIFKPFGSTYISGPNGSRTKSLSTVRDGILYAELDLDLCKQMRETLGLNQSRRLLYYKNKWTEASSNKFLPQIIQKLQ